jgi:hypothetical protein
MTDQELRLLHSLAWMCVQYLGSANSDNLNHLCMCAGQDATAMLAEYGLVELEPGGATWTEAGKQFLDRAI